MLKLLNHLLVVIINLIFISGVSGAAEIELVNKNIPIEEGYGHPESFDEFGCQVYLRGIIENGDLKKLEDILKTGLSASRSGEGFGEGANLCLSSPGGNLEEAVKIARILKEYNSATIVSENSYCESACAIIFMAGNTDNQPNRSIYPSARLGFHAPNLPLEDDKSYDSSDIAYAYDGAVEQISSVVDLNILPSSALKLFTATPSSDMSYIDTFTKAYENDIKILRKPKMKEYYDSTKKKVVTRIETDPILEIDKIPNLTWKEMINNACLQLYRNIHNGKQEALLDILETEPAYLQPEERRRRNIEKVVISRAEPDWLINVSGFAHFPGVHGTPAPCKVDIKIGEYGVYEVLINFMGTHRVTSYVLWNTNSKIADVLSNSKDVSTVWRALNVDLGSGDLTGAVKKSDARIVNVKEFTNLRMQAGMNSTVIEQIPLGATVSIVNPGGFLFYERCRAACNGSDQNAIEQCINNNDIWIEVLYIGSNGFLSRKFLE